jgi:hypothetical protein
MDVPQAHAQVFLAPTPICSRRVYDFVVDVEIGPTPIDPFASLFGLLEGGPSSSFLGLLSRNQVLVEPKLSALQALQACSTVSLSCTDASVMMTAMPCQWPYPIAPMASAGAPSTPAHGQQPSACRAAPSAPTP